MAAPAMRARAASAIFWQALRPLTEGSSRAMPKRPTRAATTSDGSSSCKASAARRMSSSAKRKPIRPTISRPLEKCSSTSPMHNRCRGEVCPSPREGSAKISRTRAASSSMEPYSTFSVARPVTASTRVALTRASNSRQRSAIAGSCGNRIRASLTLTPCSMSTPSRLPCRYRGRSRRRSRGSSSGWRGAWLVGKYRAWCEQWMNLPSSCIRRASMSMRSLRVRSQAEGAVFMPPV